MIEPDEKEKALEWAHNARIAADVREEQWRKIRVSVISSIIVGTLATIGGFFIWAADAYIRMIAK